MRLRPSRSDRFVRSLLLRIRLALRVAVWLALEHKGIPDHRKTLSFDAGDLKTGIQGAQSAAARRSWSTTISRSRIAAIAISRIAAVGPRFSLTTGQRAIQRRMVREADQCLGEARPSLRAGGDRRDAERLSAGVRLGRRRDGEYLTGELSAVDLTVYPFLALLCGSPPAERISSRTMSSDRVLPSGSIACRRSPSFDGPGRLTGNEPLRLDVSGGASAIANERTAANRSFANGRHRMNAAVDTVFLFDVDNTLLDNDRIPGGPSRTACKPPTAIASARDTGKSWTSYGAHWATWTISARWSA